MTQQTEQTVLTKSFFMDAAEGQRFCLLHTPPKNQTVHTSLVYIHPFAEEMNASRRMAAVQARAFAHAGCAVLQMDFKGCGDSSGHFEDASWTDWTSDVEMARQWMCDQYTVPLWLWGLRSGCLLAAQVSQLPDQPSQPSPLLLWQPVLSGRQHLHQFLRLHVASGIARGQCSTGTAPLAKMLEQGHMVEVAGYCLAPSLAQGLALAHLDNIRPGTEIISFELGSPVGQSISPALAAQMQRWQSIGCRVHAHAIEGDAFWQMQESSSCTALVEATLHAVLKATPVPIA